MKFTDKDVHGGGKPDDPYDGWLVRDSRDRLEMGYKATAHRGKLLSGTPRGYLRFLLSAIRELPPAARVEMALAAGVFGWDPDAGKNWVPVLVGDRHAMMSPSAFRIFQAELDRLARHCGGKVGQALEMMAVASSQTTDEELDG